MPYYAHSPRPDRGVLDPQPYQEHVNNVRNLADENIFGVFGYRPDYPVVRQIVKMAASFHDLGKLHRDNQVVLSGLRQGSLPVPHENAGVVALLPVSKTAAMLVQSHHACLPNFVVHNLQVHIQPSLSDRHNGWRGYPNSDLLTIHETIVGTVEKCDSLRPEQMRLRMMLSCLVDADHYDTARFWKSAMPEKYPVALRWELRYKQLVNLVAALDIDPLDPKKQERQQLRNLNFKRCCEADTNLGFRSCNAPVGTGKTYSCVAHALRVAIDKKKRRIFCISPLTSLIDQTVKNYEEALLLPGENNTSGRYIAAVHHKTDFHGTWSRHFAQTFNSAVVVTTAVNFFESLAGRSTSMIRKIHQIANSVIIIDESHMTLPVHLWKIAWKWLRILVQEYGCHVVLASGTQTSFWNVVDKPDETGIISAKDHVEVRPLLEDSDMVAMRKMEAKRVKIVPFADMPMNLETLAQWVTSKASGAAIVVFNTVPTSVFFTRYLKEHTKHPVIHISTAITPLDRAKKFEKIETFLKSKKPFFVVSTSVVEVGWDVSFSCGFRERSSLLSLQQLSGRVNREFEQPTGYVYDFLMVPPPRGEKEFSNNPLLIREIDVTGALLLEGKTEVEHCDTYLQQLHQRLIRDEGEFINSLALYENESKFAFEKVGADFFVIDAMERTAIVNGDICERLRNPNKRKDVSIKEIVDNSVRIDFRGTMAENLGLSQLFEDEEKTDNKLYDNLWVLNPAQYNDEYGYWLGMVEPEAVAAAMIL